MPTSIATAISTFSLPTITVRLISSATTEATQITGCVLSLRARNPIEARLARSYASRAHQASNGKPYTAVPVTVLRATWP